MKHRAILACAVLLVGIAGCSRDPVGPVALAPVYELESAGGEKLPVYSFRSVSNAAGSCVYDLVRGSVTFDEFSYYSFTIIYRVVCVGNLTPTPAHDSSEGKYTRSGDELTIVPRAPGTFAIRRVRLSSGVATVDVRMNAGEEYRFRFVASSRF